jgi:plastocyanin
VAFLMSLSFLTAAGCAVNPPPPREVTLMARGMTFVLATEPETPNPVIPLRAGERVRLILRNEAPGLLHDIAIPEWDVAVTQIRAGESAEVIFTVPNEIGRHEYRCRPHSEMMKGVVEVTP